MKSLWRSFQELFSTKPPCAGCIYDKKTDELIDRLRQERNRVEDQTKSMRRRYAYEDMYQRRDRR